MSVLSLAEHRIHPRFSGVCAHCRHWVGLPGRMNCAAFERIPMAIWLSKDDHSRPWPGDHGIRFEPVALAVGWEK